MSPPAFDGLRLMPFPLPDFVRHAKQFVGALCGREQTAVVVGEYEIAAICQREPNRNFFPMRSRFSKSQSESA